MPLPLLSAPWVPLVKTPTAPPPKHTQVHRGKALRGYIAMLTVEKPYRYLGVGEAAAALLAKLWCTRAAACSAGLLPALNAAACSEAW